MTKTTKEFIKKHFFKNDQYAGWEGIADILLENGTCIVAGDGNIWVGGIGNFIERVEATNAIGCTVLTFNVETFLKSKWYHEVATFYIDNLIEETRKIRAEIVDIITDSTYHHLWAYSDNE
jgi:hypothetical protein